MKLKGDIDIDLGDRDKLLSLIDHIPASMRTVEPIRKHASGVYVTSIPYDSINDMSTLDYVEAEKRGYFKLDLLNVHLYNQVNDEEHLKSLMREPNWKMLNDKGTVKHLIHMNNSYNLLQQMPEPVDSIPRLAMFLAVIRPAKRHLVGKTWKEISETVWDRDTDGYVFRKSHAIAYAHLVVVNMNLMKEQS